jgi:tRNA(His) 5'-end guanylyltransferase
MKDSLGDRMKENYENVFRYSLPRRSYNILRLDMKCGHSFTQGLPRPYCEKFRELLLLSTEKLIKDMQGAEFAFIQSDEISILFHDLTKITSQLWFEGNIQKISSVAASTFTRYFNEYLKQYIDTNKYAIFDCRVFTIPMRVEVFNYFVWRQQDATRNSIQMLARSLASHKECHGKNVSELQELCFQRGVNWNDMPVDFKRGTSIYKVDGKFVQDHQTPAFTKNTDWLDIRIYNPDSPDNPKEEIENEDRD